MFPGGSRIICMIYHTFPGLDLYYADLAQHLITAGWDVDDLDRDVSVQRVHKCPKKVTSTASVPRRSLSIGC